MREAWGGRVQPHSCRILYKGKESPQYEMIVCYDSGMGVAVKFAPWHIVDGYFWIV